MCRRNQLWGCVLLAFGFGMLVGTWLESGLFCHLLGLLALFCGFSVCRRK
jgi:hypothetical protein